jgi:hypothetical protein
MILPGHSIVAPHLPLAKKKNTTPPVNIKTTLANPTSAGKKQNNKHLALIVLFRKSWLSINLCLFLLR